MTSVTEYCKMHDLIHDLAHSITKNDCYIVTSDEGIEEEKLGDGIRHVSSHFYGAWEFPFGDVKTKKVRTILSPKSCKFHHTTSLPKHLRVLTLRNQVLPIPKRIRDLKQLRHLDLTGSLKLKKLPREITSLHNLLTLILNKCPNLIELPKGMKRLVRLRHLELDGCRSLMFMPCGLGCLKNLQTLTRFVIDKRRSGGARISEVRDLILLRGGLKIHGLERQRSNIKEVESSKFLRHMPYLLELKLVWSISGEGAEQKDEIILEALEPPHTIKALHIKSFAGTCLSKWIGSLTLLQTLYLKYCFTLPSLPESFGSLTSLKVLELKSCYALTSLPESFGSLTSLQTLEIFNCSALASLPESFGSLTSLQVLELESCYALASLPESFGSLTSLQMLFLKRCSALAYLPTSIKNLTSLQRVDIFNCSTLRERYGWQLEGADWPGLAHVPNVRIELGE